MTQEPMNNLNLVCTIKKVVWMAFLSNETDIIKSKSTKEVVDYLRNVKGFNVIPIKNGTKNPDLISLSQYFDKKCEVPINEGQSIALLHGKVSGTYAVDLDDKEIIYEIFNNIDTLLKGTLVIKTPKQGYHI